MSFSFDFPRKERVLEWEDLKPGDHICWKRSEVYYHHAIVVAVGKVVSVDGMDKILTYIDFRSTEESFYRSIGECKGIAEERFVYINDLKEQKLFRYNYGNPEKCLKPKEVVKRARDQIGKEQLYSLIDYNCEHFATWCKTGKASSRQVNGFLGAVVGGSIGAVAGGYVGYHTAGPTGAVVGGAVGAVVGGSVGAVVGVNVDSVDVSSVSRLLHKKLYNKQS